VDHPCEKCGALVEDGRPFCPQCRAPQIHVESSVPPAENPAAVIDAADEPSFPLSQNTSFEHATVIQPSLFDRSIAVRSALKAGFLGVFIEMIPVLGIVLTGSLGVFFYGRAKGAAATTRVGARVGAAAGVVSFAINSIVMVIRIFSMHAQQEYIEQITKIAQAVGYDTADPVIHASIQNLVTPAGLALTFFFGMLFTVALAALGGAVGAMVFRPKTRL
jgi:hypothetical protein